MVSEVRRQLPPTRRRCRNSSLMDTLNRNVGISSVVGGIRRRAYCSRRCKTVPASNIESLPNDVLSEILVRLSADEICEKARFVCRNWYRIIHSDAFVDAHLHRHGDNWGLILSRGSYLDEQPLFMCVRQGAVEISELCHTHYPIIPSSCNGLVLMESSDHTANIVNLATKQAFSLPPVPPGNVFFSTFGIAYAAASMEYKVVRAYAHDCSQIFTHILTAGVDNNWRCVGVDNLSCEAKLLLIKKPLITQGFMHWTCEHEGTLVLTLNMETEVFTESCVPIHPHPIPVDDYSSRMGDNMFYLSTGRHLSLLFPCGVLAWEVWEMEVESGEWRKLLPNIALEAHEWLVEKEMPDERTCSFFVPLGWVKYPVLLLLYYGSRTCIVYDLETDEIECFIKLPHPSRYYNGVVHRNTLEWLS